MLLRSESLPAPFPYKALRSDGSVLWVEVRSRPFTWEGKAAFQSIVRDVTERKQAEDEKHQLELHLRHSQKMEAVGTLAGGVAHDFNNLLQAVQGYAELLLIGKKENDNEFKARKQSGEPPNVKVLIASGYTFNGTIKEAVEAGAGGFINKPYDLHQMLKEIRGVLDKD